MKKLFSLSAILFAAAAMLFVACKGGGTADRYAHMLPANSFVTFAVNPNALADKAKVGDFTKSPLYQTIASAITEDDDFEPAVRDYVLSLIAEPGNSGLDMSKNAYLFMAIDGNGRYPQASGGALMAIKDTKKFQEFIAFLREEGELEKVSGNGFEMLVIEDRWSGDVLAYNEDAMMFYHAEEYDEMLPVIQKLFTQKKEEGLLGNKHIETAFAANHDACAVMSYSGMPMMSEMFGVGSLFSTLSKATGVMPINFEKGKIVMDSRVVFSDKEAEKEYAKMYDMMDSQKGDLMRYIPEGSLATIGVNLNGSKMYDFVMSMPAYKQLVEYSGAGQMVKLVMDALEGDFILSFNKMASDGEVPYATLVTQINNPSTVQTLMGMAAMLPINEVAPYQYEADIDGVTLWFGMKDKMFYGTTDPAAIAAINGEKINSIEKRFGHVFNGSYGTFAVDMAALRPMIDMLIENDDIDEDVLLALPIFELFDTIEVSAHKKSEGKSVVHMTDKDRNAAEAIYKTIETLVTMVVGMNM